jgi:hypothetical protein
MNAALKEWACVIAALGAGKQTILLRKGGVVEGMRGFKSRHPEFLLFPTFEVQHASWLRPEFQTLAAEQPTNQLQICHLARVTDVIAAPDSLGAVHIWTDEFLTARRAYRPELPLFLILVRVYRLANPVTIPNRIYYAGCKSWVRLMEDIDISGAEPVLDDGAYDKMCRSC